MGKSTALVYIAGMAVGRVIRVRKYRSDMDAAIYVVAAAERDKAVGILQSNLSRPDDEYEDLGRVSDKLISALNLKPGEFARL
jgi:hypothetical protein